MLLYGYLWSLIGDIRLQKSNHFLVSIFTEIVKRSMGWRHLKGFIYLVQGICQLSESGGTRLQIMLNVGGKPKKFMASISDLGQNSPKVGGWAVALPLRVTVILSNSKIVNQF